MSRALARRTARLAALLLAACDLGKGSDTTLLSPSPGLPRFQEPAALEVPGGTVNVD